MPDEKDFPIDADNFTEEVEIEFIDSEGEDVAGEEKPAVEGVAEAPIID